MRILKRINHNAVICLDSKGREVVALGNGIGFPHGDDEVSVDRVDRTFYDIEPKYLALLSEIPIEILNASAQIADVIRGVVPYELSPNYPLTLADHVSFMLRRVREGMSVRMPLSYDIAQFHPIEYKLGRFTVERIERTFNVVLGRDEATGIALGILSAAVTPTVDRDAQDIGKTIECVTRSIETELHITVDRDSIGYARFATHMQYLLQRSAGSASQPADEAPLLAVLTKESPHIMACAHLIADQLETELNASLGDNERVYLAMHMKRLHAAAAGERAVAESSHSPHAVEGEAEEGRKP